MKKKVVVVDDSITIRTMLKNTLDKDYDVFVFASGLDAVAFMEEQECNAVISDLNMPIINGTDLIKMIKSKFRFIPCILLTSEDGVEALNQAKSAGAATYLKKPFNEAQIKRLLFLTIGV